MYKAVIIDDEKNAQKALKNIIEEYCDSIEIIDLADSVETGVKLITDSNPDIVFLDIDMQDGTGFDLLNQLKKRDFSLIFCTAHNEFAIKAFRYNAIDYILKPLDIQEIISATDKAIANISLHQKNISIDNLLSFYQNKGKTNDKIILKTLSDIFIISINDIYHCESEGGYTTFYTTDNKKITVSKNLKEYEAILKPHNFFRTHQSHLINLDYVERLHKTEGAYIVMKNGSKIAISTRKKQTFIDALEKIGGNY